MAQGIQISPSDPLLIQGGYSEAMERAALQRHRPLRWDRLPYEGQRLVYARFKQDELFERDWAVNGIWLEAEWTDILDVAAGQLIRSGINWSRPCIAAGYEGSTLLRWILDQTVPLWFYRSLEGSTGITHAQVRDMGCVDRVREMEPEWVELAHVLIREYLADWLGIDRGELRQYASVPDDQIAPILIDCSSL